MDALDGLLERHDKSVVGGFTIILAISTIGLWFATNSLYRAGEKQLEFLRESSVAQSRDMQASIEAAKVSAEAAMKAANTAERALFLEQRPWLQWKFPAALTAAKAGRHITVNVQSIVENTGKTPALNVLIGATLYNIKRTQPVVNIGWGHQDKLAEDYRTSQFTITTIMPGKDQQRPMNVTAMAAIDELLMADRDGSFQLYLAVHLGYRIFDGGTIATTSSVYQLNAVVPSIVITQDPHSKDTLQEIAFTAELFERNKVIPVVLMELPMSRRTT
ncbi:hypothetical protein [Bradyrhizobium sp. RDM4]|uniref:hypothetical protein n=1 Tax=Bradyrhizobium sp. RDM4 TaxID=3378765 RepID=UPI0038FCF87C